MIKRLVIGVIEQARVILVNLSTVVVGVGGSSVGSGVCSHGGVSSGVSVGVRSSSGVGQKLGLRFGVGAGAGESHGQHGEEGELKTKIQPHK